MSYLSDYRRMVGFQPRLQESAEPSNAHLALIKKIAKKAKVGDYNPREVGEALAFVEPGWKSEITVGLIKADGLYELDPTEITRNPMNTEMNTLLKTLLNSIESLPGLEEVSYKPGTVRTRIIGGKKVDHVKQSDGSWVPVQRRKAASTPAASVPKKASKPSLVAAPKPPSSPEGGEKLSKVQKRMGIKAQHISKVAEGGEEYKVSTVHRKDGSYQTVIYDKDGTQQFDSDELPSGSPDGSRFKSNKDAHEDAKNLVILAAARKRTKTQEREREEESGPVEQRMAALIESLS